MTPQVLNIIQIALAVLLTASILLQQRGTELGGAFGSSGDNIVFKKRGPEQFLFISTIVLSGLFFAAAIGNLFLV